MNKTLLKTTMIAAIASLSMGGQVWAHHPSEDMNPNFDLVDEQVSDMHIEIIDEMLEDGDLMSSTARGMDSTMSPNMAEGGGASTFQSGGQVSVVSGRGSASAARGSAR